MLHHHSPTSILVVATGCATKEFTKAHFVVSVAMEATKGSIARDDAEKATQDVNAIIAAHGKYVQLDEASMEISSELVPLKVYKDGAHVHNGYRYTTRYAFDVKDVTNLDNLGRFHRALTDVEGASVSAPVFSVEDPTEGENLAFVDAVEKARKQFQHRCKATGIAPEGYRILSFETKEDASRGLRTLGDASSSSPFLAPGRALIEQTVTFLFDRVAGRHTDTVPC